MTEPSIHAGRSTQNIRLIEADPLSPATWEALADQVRGQNDPLSIKSLEVIIEGLKKIEEVNTAAKEKETAPLRISALSKSMFTRLARAYNSPTLLKEVGMIYLRDLGLPNVALLHFERSMRLGGPEKELRPLSEAAAVAVQRQMAQRTGAEAGHSGITSAQHAQPVAPDIIRKTGKILMPSRPNLPAAGGMKPVPVVPDEPLPATTKECLEKAQIAIKVGHLARAHALLRKANEQPGDKTEMWQAWTDLGQAYFEAGQCAPIEEAFVEALRYDPEELASQFNAALGYQLNSKYDLALATYLKANKINPKHPKVWCNLGVLYFQTDQYPQAESALRFATMASPEYARAWDNLAAALGAQDKLDEALIACKRAVELRPEYPEAFLQDGRDLFSAEAIFAHAAEEFARAARHPAIFSLLRLVFRRSSMRGSSRRRRRKRRCSGRSRRIRNAICCGWRGTRSGWRGTRRGISRGAATAYGEATIIVPTEPQAWFQPGREFFISWGDLDAGARFVPAGGRSEGIFPGGMAQPGASCARRRGTIWRR